MRGHSAILISPFLFLFASTGTEAVAQGLGSIHGSVVDERSSPIRGVLVNASVINGRPTSTLVRYVETDVDGRFVIDHLGWGAYAVFAKKEEDGYPDMAASFYSNDIFPTVAIEPSSPSAEIRIQLGPKAGIVTGSVRNSATGAPVNAGFRLVRVEAPEKWLSTSVPPTYRILIPSSTHVLLEASAPGFKTWSLRHPLLLQPGAELELDIALELSHYPNLHPSKFLVPRGFVGWLFLDYNVKNAQPAPTDGGFKVFRFPDTGALQIATSGPERGADDQYFFYSPDGSLEEIPPDYRNGKGMIWGVYEGTRDGTLSQFGFFVGTEEQYKKFQTRINHPGPVIVPKY